MIYYTTNVLFKISLLWLEIFLLVLFSSKQSYLTSTVKSTMPIQISPSGIFVALAKSHNMCPKVVQ